MVQWGSGSMPAPAARPIMWPSPVEPVPVEDMLVENTSSGRHQASTILGFIS